VAETVQITLSVNGERRTLEAEPRLLLSDALRHGLGLTGTHVGCEHGVCGACTVLWDGEPVRSCLIFAVQAEGAELTTVEGLTADGPGEGGEGGAAASGEPSLHPLQEAFRAEHALQCGFCTAGILLTLTAFLREHPRPDEREIREALSGHLCRCTGYQNIVRAVQRVAGTGRGGSEHEPEAADPGRAPAAGPGAEGTPR